MYELLLALTLCCPVTTAPRTKLAAAALVPNTPDCLSLAEFSLSMCLLLENDSRTGLLILERGVALLSRAELRGESGGVVRREG